MIRFQHVSKTYEQGVRAIHDMNLQIEQGEFVFVCGRSGSGKTTFLKLLLKELEPSAGTIRVDEMDLVKLRRSQLPRYRRKLGVVFQDFRLLSDRSVFDNVALAQHVIGAPGRQIRQNVEETLALVGLEKKTRSLPDQLSGGEQQRVAIARALVNRPEILLADEPTGNLDPTTSLGIMKLLERVHALGTTVIVVTHDAEMVNRMQKRVVTMRHGVIASDEASGRYQDEEK